MIQSVLVMPLKMEYFDDIYPKIDARSYNSMVSKCMVWWAALGGAIWGHHLGPASLLAAEGTQEVGRKERGSEEEASSGGEKILGRRIIASL